MSDATAPRVGTHRCGTSTPPPKQKATVQRCPSCGLRMRGKNHAEGYHHKNHKAKN